MNLKERKEIVKKISSKIFEKYKQKGLLSILWYESGLGNLDFDEKSDIDLMGISSDEFNINLEKKIIHELQKSDELDIRIRILYLSELNGREFKGNVARFLPIKLWLINFENYIYLQGKNFCLNDFKVKKANFDEAIKIEYEMYLEKKKQFLENNRLGMYLVKSSLYYFYYVSCKARGYFKFSYSKLSKNALPEFRELIDILIEIKNNNYNIQDTKNIIPKIDRIILK